MATRDPTTQHTFKQYLTPHIVNQTKNTLPKLADLLQYNDMSM